MLELPEHSVAYQQGPVFSEGCLRICPSSWAPRTCRQLKCIPLHNLIAECALHTQLLLQIPHVVRPGLSLREDHSWRLSGPAAKSANPNYSTVINTKPPSIHTPAKPGTEERMSSKVTSFLTGPAHTQQSNQSELQAWLFIRVFQLFGLIQTPIVHQGVSLNLTPFKDSFNSSDFKESS